MMTFKVYKNVNQILSKIPVKDTKIFLRKNKKYGREGSKNFQEDEKQRLVEHRKIYYKMRKNN